MTFITIINKIKYDAIYKLFNKFIKSKFIIYLKFY